MNTPAMVSPIDLLSDIYIVYQSIVQVMPGSSETQAYENLLRANNQALADFISGMEAVITAHSSQSAEVPS